jgi:hypothetical protein
MLAAAAAVGAVAAPAGGGAAAGDAAGEADLFGAGVDAADADVWGDVPVEELLGLQVGFVLTCTCAGMCGGLRARALGYRGLQRCSAAPAAGTRRTTPQTHALSPHTHTHTPLTHHTRTHP